MKTILLPFRDGAAGDAALAVAHMVARRFGGYIEGLLVRRTQQIIAAEGFVLPPESLSQLTENEEVLADYSRRFQTFVEANDVPIREVTYTRDPVSAGWREVDGIESQVIGDYGRLFDLIVVGRALDQSTAGWLATCEAALFESGRPVLITSERVPERLGETVCVAWNGSTETARTIAVGMPFLVGAKSVVVLTVEGGTVPGPSGQQVANHLLRNGIEARAVTAAPRSRSVGETILDEAAEAGADMLIKGAYTQNRLRQMIFGGATRHLLTAADIPVLMAH
ncbi:MAG: universal stress protein [Alphaproteobacteria bacterium]|jgi:nucleotide-binding universal stress UspA family protein|nr:universal stress protein [Alphaproteobacteria bacterium]